MERLELKKLLRLRVDDTVVIWKVDRLGRSLVDLLTSPLIGQNFLFIFAAVAEFERDIWESTKAGP